MTAFNISKKDLLDLRDKGYSRVQMAEYYGCSLDTIAHRLSYFGLVRKYMRKKDRIKMIDMAKIYTAEDIAKIYNIDVRTVYYWLNRLGINAQTKSKKTSVPNEQKKDNLPEWKKKIYKYYGVIVDDNDAPNTKGVNCMKKCKRDCKYCSGTECVYLLIENHKRPCPPWNCTAYVKTSIKEKRNVQSGIRIKEV